MRSFRIGSLSAKPEQPVTNLARLCGRSSSTPKLFFGPEARQPDYKAPSAMRRKLASFTAWGVVLGALHVTGNHAHAESFSFRKPDWDALSTFLKVARDQIGARRVVVEATIDWDSLTPEDSLLVIHPEADLSFSEASAFLSAGGRLGVIDDYGRADDLLRRFQIQRVPAPAPAEAFRDNVALAIAHAHWSTSETGVTLTHPIAEEVDRVVTNHPQGLRELPGVELTRVLTLRGKGGESVALAVVGVIGDAEACGLNPPHTREPNATCGRLFAMSDPSVFIDLMMQFEGNQKLARGVVKYLADSDVWGQRGGKLYIVANRFSQVGHFGRQSTVRDMFTKAVESIHSTFRDLQTRGLPARAATAFAFLWAVFAALWAWRSGGRLYPRPTPKYAAAVPLIAQGGLAGRSAVLSADSTPETLRVLELKSALEAQLRASFGLGLHDGFQQLVERADASGHLRPADSTKLRSLHSHFQSASETLTRGASIHRAATLEKLVSELQETLSRLPHANRRSS